MSTLQRPRLLLAGNIPPELRNALEPSYELVSRAIASPDTASEFQVAVTTSLDGADAALMESFPNLRLIACNGAGVERFDLKEAARRGIAICNTPDAVTEDTADFGIGLIYALLRRLIEGDRFVRGGKWKSGKMSPSFRVAGKVLGIVGLGKIGSAVARRAAALDMRVCYTATRGKVGVPYRYFAILADLAEASDVLILTVPGGKATEKLIDAEILKKLGSRSFLINISRGSVVDEGALIAALGAGTVAGAALDVFASEPHLDERLLAFDNVVVEPHYAAVTHETRADIAEDLRQNIASFFKGGPVRDAAAPVSYR